MTRRPTDVQDVLRRRVMQRARAGAGALLVVGASVGGAAGAGLLSGQARGGAAPGQLVIRLVADGREVAHVYPGRYEQGGVLDAQALRTAVVDALPLAETVAKGPARITYRVDRTRTARRAVRLASSGGTVAIVRGAVASTITAPVTAQALHNNCETAALSVLLATAGKQVDQRRLQAQVARSGPLDPVSDSSGRIWGDPSLGFVGRPDGGGVAGGFGVYQRPIADLAARSGVAVDDLSGGPARRVYGRLLSGHAVMVWVGLSDGPYGEWRSPRGRRIRVNFGEHAVVLTGVGNDGSVRLVNVLHGTLEHWTQSEFQTMWRRLGRRALAA